jgi:hypothetical protein
MGASERICVITGKIGPFGPSDALAVTAVGSLKASYEHRLVAHVGDRYSALRSPVSHLRGALRLSETGRTVRDRRFPRLKQLLEASGLKLGSLVRVPLTTAHRRLGVLGIANQEARTFVPNSLKYKVIRRRWISGVKSRLACRLRLSQVKVEENRNNYPVPPEHLRRK